MTSTTTDPRTETTPTTTALALGSLAVVVVAVLAGLLAGQAIIAVGLGGGQGLSIDSVVSVVVTGAGLGLGSFVLGSRVGTPTFLHLAVGASGAAVLGLAGFLTGPSLLVSALVLAAYVGLSVLGLVRGNAAR